MDELIKFFAGEAERLGAVLNEEQIGKFFTYKDLLLSWNEKMNLTAITDEREIIIKHFLDSLSVSQALNIEQGKRYKMIDIGTGAGFPGIPLKILYPSAAMTLLDSLNKRLVFLNDVKEKLFLDDIAIINARAEEYGKNTSHRQAYDYCFSRAVARLNILAELCLPYVKIGGAFIALKGADVSDEIKEAENALEFLGGSIFDIKTISLPDGVNHCLICIKKVRHTPIKFPRIYAQITKKPLK